MIFRLDPGMYNAGLDGDDTDVVTLFDYFISGMDGKDVLHWINSRFLLFFCHTYEMQERWNNREIGNRLGGSNNA